MTARGEVLKEPATVSSVKRHLKMSIGSAQETNRNYSIRMTSIVMTVYGL